MYVYVCVLHLISLKNNITVHCDIHVYILLRVKREEFIVITTITAIPEIKLMSMCLMKYHVTKTCPVLN